jgi:hypothetical protein
MLGKPKRLNADAFMAGFVRSIQASPGVTKNAELRGELCLNPQCDKDLDSVFVVGQPGKRKPPVRKTEIVKLEACATGYTIL